MSKQIVYVKLQHPTGRITIKKLRVEAKTLSGIQKEYLGTEHHFKTEAYPIKIISKPKDKFMDFFK